MTRYPRIGLAILALAAASISPGSGGPPPQPTYIATAPEDEAERVALGSGRVGIVKTTTSDALLYADWRLLNALELGTQAVTALAAPCCGTPGNSAFTWLAARREIPGLPDVYYLPTERPAPDYTSAPNCFDDAFATAAATLADRVRRFGKDAPAVRAWVTTQDAVFAACAKAGVTLPALASDAPAWLRADHGYQEAALALYDGRPEDAARRFAAISRDRGSSWQPLGLYLEARALQRAARSDPSPAHYAAAHAAIARLGAAPAGAYGRGEVVRMSQVLEFAEHPEQLLARLDRDLAARRPMADIAVAFRDYTMLSNMVAARPEAADWIRTVQGRPANEALPHAIDRWRATRRSAWLVAALGLVEPGSGPAAALVHDAESLAPVDPAWIAARYHMLRLKIASADPATTRARVDAVLARTDLTRTDRNVFAAIRTQRATGLADFAVHALRSPRCETAVATCVEGNWFDGDGLIGRRADGTFAVLGPDARAIADLLPMRERIALATDASLPRDIRLDLALTSFARAMQLQDEQNITVTARLLATLLPQTSADWSRVAATAPGVDRRFAEAFVMSKIPSIRVDLADYARPVGTVREFGGYWMDWLLVPRRAEPPARVRALAGIVLPERYLGEASEEARDVATDLTCRGECGAGSFPLQLPSFVAAALPRIRAEQGYFITRADVETSPRLATISLWEDALAFLRVHPRDPRAPEALYRLIRVARWGGGHDRLGRRAFLLLHARYPKSPWTRLSPYYYD